MSMEILVNVTPRESRVALVENGVLQEVYIERARRRGLVGNIYKGKVVRVLPGMQAAFIEIGLERTAFLHASDIAKVAYAGDEQLENGKPADIRELLHDGKELLVQVLKDPLGTKGARLTTHISIPSRYLVYLPEGTTIGLSTRIEDEEERARLRAAVTTGLESQPDIRGGFIVRTAGEGASLDAIRADMIFLSRLWDSLRNTATNCSAGELVHEDLPLPVRILRDQLDAEVAKVRVDSESVYRRMKQFAEQFTPELSGKVELYSGDRPIFDIYSVEEEIQRALDKKVMLKSGGHLVLEQTEAMTTVDVNTGAYVGFRNLEETILKTNLEAAQSIARQLRLRNLGGIIIIDFIDMHEPEHKEMVIGALQKALQADHAKTKITELSQLGLVEMTRKRTRESLEHVLCETCPTCGGRGSVKTPETVSYEIFREILRETRQFSLSEILVIAAQGVVDLLLEEESTSLAELEAQVGIPIRLQVETLYSAEQFDVVPM